MKTTEQLLHLEEEEKDEDWIVENLIQKGTVNLLAGESCCGKTLLVLQLIEAITRKKEFLGRKTKEVSILFISSEASYKNLSKRIKDVDIDPKAKVKYDCEFDVSLNNLQFKASDYDFIIIDVLADLFKTKAQDNHNYWDVTEVFSSIRKSELLKDKTFLMLHHLNKAKGVMGSEAYNSCPDTRMILTSPNGKNEPYRMLEIYGKEVPVQAVPLRINYPYLEVTDEVAERESVTNKILAITINYVLEHNGVEGTPSEVIKKLGLVKEGCYPSQYTIFLNLNQKTLKNNCISLETGRNHSGRYIKMQKIEEE